MPQYDSTHFSPAAPIARVTLRVPESNKSVTEVPMLIDSGADVTLLPKAAIDFLDVEANEGEGFQLAGFDGRLTVSSAVRVELVLGSKTFKGQFLVVDQPWGILGRNVLNRLVLVLDGPRQT